MAGLHASFFANDVVGVASVRIMATSPYEGPLPNVQEPHPAQPLLRITIPKLPMSLPLASITIRP